MRLFNAGADWLGENDLLTETIEALLVMTNTTVGSDTDSGISTIADFTTLDEHDGSNYSRQNLAGKTLDRQDDPTNNAKFDSSDPDFSTLNAGTRNVAGVLLAAVDGANRIPLTYHDYQTPRVADGSQFTVEWPAAGIFLIQQGSGARVFNAGLDWLGENDLLTATIKVLLLMTNSTADTETDSGLATIDDFTTLDEHDGSNYARQTLGNKTLVPVDDPTNHAKFDAGDADFSTLNAGTRDIEGVMLAIDPGASLIPLSYHKYQTARVANGTQFDVPWRTDTGILTIEQS